MKRIYNICPYTYYRNEQFMKDCILLPYTFSRVYNFQTVIVTAKREEYTYLELLPGLITEIVLPTITQEQWSEFACDYIRQNYDKIDILFCFGSYDTNRRIIPLYKRLNPNGKVILKLDMNSSWADKLSLAIPELKEMYENCDLITCESKRIKKLLSEKWPYPIEYIVNGYLEEISPLRQVSYEEKEDVILTVGRLGTAAKANHILVEAFVKCAKQYPNWSIRLVGSIEPEFQHYMNEIYQNHPDIKSRIQLTGKILDKQQLNEEYRKAKIFALTSTVEGLPNVFSEAARSGCYMVNSEIDAANEMTNWEKCGKKFPINNVEGLARIFEEILDSSFASQLRQSCDEIQEYHRRYFDYKKMVQKLMHLLELEEQMHSQEGGEV